MWCVDSSRSGFAGSVLTLVALLSSLAGCATVSKPVEAVQAAAPAAVASVVAEPKPAAPVVAPIAAATRAQFGRALQAQIAGRHEEALRQWNTLALAHPELGGVHANIGLIHRQAGRHTEAVAALERAVQASPTEPRFFNELGIAYRSNGQFEKSRQAYESALALDPNHAAVVLNLGILHDLYLGNGPKALELYERYLALAPGGDATVTKWAADLRQRKPAPAAQATQDAPVTALSAQVAKNGKEQP
jgi:Flp pilus assembly protein TadD